ncbi:hypothetical protein Ahy_A09g045011 isoform B [Arachis hypogaea]|uniref:Transmembrane protein n=1 Tax=Arachis hypogaea TaxID=3818 RepID=A0A445BLA6_ARAHY|nr:hypothetical protein Ahy_A09g045011 isoform B [Arachis hypogaea]
MPSLALIEAVPPSPSSLCSPHHRCCAALTIVISVLLIIVFAVLTSLNRNRTGVKNVKNERRQGVEK